MSYATLIRELLADRDYDTRHVEAYMRLAHRTLDALSRDQFATEVEIGIQCIDEGGREAAEQLARSYGL